MAGLHWVVIQHEPDDGPGMLGEELIDAGCTFRLVRTDQGDSLPPVDGMGGLVVMGGEMGVHDGDAHPWLALERQLLADAVGLGLPVLGICLGAQQLAAALGAEVTTGAEPEIGVRSVTLTAEGRRDPVLGPEYGGLSEPALPVVEWHGDTFSLPEGAVHLAATRVYPNQAFRVGERVYGFQFHAEVDRQMAEVWEPMVPGSSTFMGSPRLTEATVVGRRVLRRYVDLVLASTSQRTPSPAVRHRG
jgi:GMP synthase-like glutamine amidotransferase